MTLQQFQYALTVAEVGSVNKAAERLFVSQPTITSSIRELEVELGILIFTRTSRGMLLTTEGKTFLQYAQGVVQQYEVLRDKFIEKENDRERFCVSIQHLPFVSTALMNTARRFDAKKYEFTIRETKTQDIINEVGNLRSQVGIIFRSDYNYNVISKLLRDNELDFKPLIESKSRVQLWKGHPLAKEESITLEQLDKFPLLLYDQGEKGSRYMTEEVFFEYEFKKVIYVTDRSSKERFLIGMNGFTFSPSIDYDAAKSCSFITVPLKNTDDNYTMEIGYIIKRGFHLDTVSTAFLEDLQMTINNMTKISHVESVK